MKNRNLPLKIFVYTCIWILAFVLVNIAIGAVGVLVYGKEHITSMGFERGMLLINEQPSGISMHFFFGLTVLLTLLVIGYRRLKRAS